jgi:large-conductance mechanosensitive channel
MDIAKYIGLYLLKNKFCYLHGLGNLQIVRKAAVHDNTAIQAPQYEVLLSPLGSVDDSFANFIATNEQVSIAAAANALRDFSIQAKADLKAGKEVLIPAIGKFVNNSNGTVYFITDENLNYQPAPIPIVPKRAEDAPSFQKYNTEPTPTATVNWGKIILLSLIALVVLGSIIFGIIYVLNSQSGKETTTAAEQPLAPAAAPESTIAAPSIPDTTAQTDTAIRTTTVADNNGTYQVVLNTYNNLPKAEKRKKQLEASKNVVDIITQDSATYWVVMPISGTAADTVHVLDSLRVFFNPKGVYIYRP